MKGVTCLEWCKDTPAEVEIVAAFFRRNREAGRPIFAVGPSGKLGKELKEFDPTIECLAVKPRPTVWDRLNTKEST